jgi:hypothetical protein
MGTADLKESWALVQEQRAFQWPELGHSAPKLGIAKSVQSTSGKNWVV